MRSRVLKSFRLLHRAGREVFEGDQYALTAVRKKINEEYAKNKGVTEEANILKLVRLAEDSSTYLRSAVVQAKFESQTTAYKVNLKDKHLVDNATMPDPRTGGGCS